MLITHAIRKLARIAMLGAVAALVFTGSFPAGAADYFAGRTVRIIVGSSLNSAYGLYGQLAVRHLGRFIPGNPTLVISHLPGAAGLNAMDYLYNVAPHDGTVLAVPIQDLATRQVLGTPGVRYDATKFNFIGRATANVPVHVVWHDAPVKSFDDLRTHEIMTGASASQGDHVDLPRAENVLLGTKWKIVSGYADFGGRSIALQRGEVQAIVVPATLFADQLKPWLDKGQAKVIVQYADFRHPLFPDVPTILDLANTPEAKGVFEFLVSLAGVGRAYMAPPDVPPDVLAILRKAFDTMIMDPEFKADAQHLGADLLPMSGEELATYINHIVATPPDVVRKTKEVTAAAM